MFGHSEQLNLSVIPTSSNPDAINPVTEQIQGRYGGLFVFGHRNASIRQVAVGILYL